MMPTAIGCPVPNQNLPSHQRTFGHGYATPCQTTTRVTTSARISLRCYGSFMHLRYASGEGRGDGR
jgi:hypothetical protein